jgi:hypothetical protein
MYMAVSNLIQKIIDLGCDLVRKIGVSCLHVREQLHPGHDFIHMFALRRLGRRTVGQSNLLEGVIEHFGDAGQLPKHGVKHRMLVHMTGGTVDLVAATNSCTSKVDLSRDLEGSIVSKLLFLGWLLGVVLGPHLSIQKLFTIAAQINIILAAFVY